MCSLFAYERANRASGRCGGAMSNYKPIPSSIARGQLFLQEFQTAHGGTRALPGR
jgi:hypothetical protein